MYDDDWWRNGSNATGCTAAEIETALVGVMVMDIQALASREEITVSGRVSMKSSTTIDVIMNMYATDGHGIRKAIHEQDETLFSLSWVCI